jgi:hypothetical protein
MGPDLRSSSLNPRTVDDSFQRSGAAYQLPNRAEHNQHDDADVLSLLQAMSIEIKDLKKKNIELEAAQSRQAEATSQSSHSGRGDPPSRGTILQKKKAARQCTTSVTTVAEEPFDDILAPEPEIQVTPPVPLPNPAEIYYNLWLQNQSYITHQATGGCWMCVRHGCNRICGQHLWTTFVDNICGQQLWTTFGDTICGRIYGYRGEDI